MNRWQQVAAMVWLGLVIILLVHCDDGEYHPPTTQERIEMLEHRVDDLQQRVTELEYR
jgi:hypothetical protein